ncbi:MATE family efflux transporter [uncultured Alistipes sp.]|jgi:MATE efflux family protein|uniref:MATE family efflux transporter n=1 Tax=uncultured Alistipes sp. TaxID=538949 RepID=UPI0025FD9536|nr:MATE family efflux transporter [uncultured Alistipes sp.]
MQRDRIDFKNTDVGKLFRRFLIPTVTGMVFSAVFVITDGIFVGRGIGSDALASVNLVAPLFTVGTGLGLMFGMGGSVVASINLAQGKRRAARLNVTQSLAVPALLITLLSALLLVCRKPMLTLLGTPAELMEPAGEYFRWFTLFLMPLAVFNILTFIVRLDGAPRFAMACNIAAACINIVLDYLFIFEFGWGLAGAAVATGIGYIVGSAMMLWYMLRRSRTVRFLRLKVSRKSLALTARNLGYMSYIGFPALLSELAISCLMIVGNYVFIHYTGKDGVAAYSIACYIFPIIFMVYNGIIQAAQPIISYNYGARELERGRRAFHLAVRTAFACGIFFFVFTWLGCSQIVGLFLRPGTPAYDLAIEGLTWFALGYPFFGINVVIIGYYQSIERGRLATGLTVVRGIALMAFCFLVMPGLAGITGIWLAVPAAELLTTILLIVLLRTKRYSAA